MKLLRCLSSLYMKSYHCFSSGAIAHGIDRNIVTQCSKLYITTSRREIHRRSAVLSYNSEVFEDDELSTKRVTPEEYTNDLVNEWFSEFIQKLSISPDSPVDWDAEFQNKFPRFPYCAMSKIVNTQTYYNGMYQSGISLMEYLQSKVKDGLGTMSNSDIISLINKISLAVHQKNDHKLAIELYRDLCRRASHDGEILLDSSSCQILTKALSKTNHWKECLDLLEIAMFTQSNQPSMCSDILQAALRENEDEIAEKMLDLIEKHNSVPSAGAFEAMVRHRPVSYLIRVLRDQRMVVRENVADIIMEHYRKFATVEKIKLDKRSCPSCDNEIRPRERISPDEMRELVRTFTKKVFIRDDDIFINSDPEEVDRFERFIASRPKYDLVIDGLNVMYGGIRNLSDREKDNLLFHTLKYFGKSDKRILVLCRTHLENKLRMSRRVQELLPGTSVDFFFIKNQSQDDLFLLYASLQGNDGCNVVTNDEFRDHGARLGPRLTRVFKNWQQKHQVTFRVQKESRRLMFQWPPRHEVVAQWSRDGTIHIPYMDESCERKSFSHTDSWLCISSLECANESQKAPKKDGDRPLARTEGTI